MPTMPFTPLSTFWQTISALSGCVIKPGYMLLNIYLLKRLYGQKDPLVRLLWLGMLLFFLGEAFCAVNYLLYGLTSVSMELVHELFMVISFVFIGFAVMEYIDQHVLFASVEGKPCALLRVCKACPKTNTQEECNLKFLYKLLMLFFLLMALFPLFRPILTQAYKYDIFGTIYIKEHLPIYQLLEKRVFPVIGIVAAFITLGLLSSKSEKAFQLSRWTAATTLAFIGFGLARAIIFHAHLDNLILMDFWEEATEFAMVAFFVAIVWKYPHIVLEQKAEKAEEPN